jgi:lipoprotein-anchoring transpeptidase ErfK/SrfK
MPAIQTNSRRRAPARMVLTGWMLLAARGVSAGAPDATRGDPADRNQVIAWQAALEREGFSPGLIDGLAGPKSTTAARAFQLYVGLPATGRIDEATSAALHLDGAAPTIAYRISVDDARQVDYCPPDWNERSRRERLLYATLSSCIAERFHTSERCLAWLNPDTDLAALKSGDELVVPNVAESTGPSPVSLEIDLEQKLILLFDKSGKVSGILHCSVARDLTAVVRGETEVKTVVVEPGYTFDPKLWPEVTDVDHKLAIPSGPRSPVGLRWIGLDRPGVGIHGAPEPENIGKTGSHGCFRLTNWDAVRLASILKVGTKVRIVDHSEAAGSLVASR